MTAPVPAPVELAIMRAIDEYHRAHGAAPSLRDLAGPGTYSSPGHLLQRLRTMRERGLVDYRDGVTRSLRVCRPADHELLAALLAAVEAVDLKRLPPEQAAAVREAVAAARVWLPGAPEGGAVCNMR